MQSLKEEEVLTLFLDRRDDAIKQTKAKYGKLLFHIAKSILHSREDAEECVNDAYLKAWNSIPPQRPEHFEAYLCAIVRNLAFDKAEKNKRQRRGGGVADDPFEELSELLCDENAPPLEEQYALKDAIARFVASLETLDRAIFVQRYFYMTPIAEIAYEHGMGKSSVKMRLLRTRNRFREFLIQEGFHHELEGRKL